MNFIKCHYFLYIYCYLTIADKIPKSISNVGKQNIQSYTNFVAKAGLGLLASTSRPATATASLEDKWYNPYNQRIYDTSRKSYLPSHPEVYLRKELGNRNVIVIGEVHSNPCHHRVEFEVIKTLANSDRISKSNIAIGMESFYRQHQSLLDQFIFEHKNFEKLKSDTNWSTTWGYDLNYYSKILRYASDNSIRIIGLNIPQPVAHYVSVKGLKELPENIWKYLPEIDTSDEKHRIQFVEAITSAGVSSGHLKLPPNTMNYLYETQCLWDDYMAESAANYILKYPSHTLVVLAGSGHVLGRSGIPQRIHKRVQKNEPPFVIVSQQVDWLPSTGLPDIDYPLSIEDCDWAWYTEKELMTATTTTNTASSTTSQYQVKPKYSM